MDCTRDRAGHRNRTNIGTATGVSVDGTEVEDDGRRRSSASRSVDIDKTCRRRPRRADQTVTFTIIVEVADGPVTDAVVIGRPARRADVRGRQQPSTVAAEPVVADGRRPDLEPRRRSMTATPP